MIELSGVHREYETRVLSPVRAALGMPTVDWLETLVDRVTKPSRTKTHIVLNPALRTQLGIASIQRDEYVPILDRETYHSRPRDWTGSISFGPRGHNVAIIRGSSPKNVRALEAHEFGHALLYLDHRVWTIVNRASLLVDSAVERLADDAGRALLLPSSLLSDYFAPLREREQHLQTREYWKCLTRISSDSITPHRLVAARIAQFIGVQFAIIICYSINRQRSLFDVYRREDEIDAAIPWVMLFTKSPNISDKYVFCDRIAEPRRIKLRGALAEEACNSDLNVVSSALVDRLLGRGLRKYQNCFSDGFRVGVSVEENERHFVVLE